MFRISALLLTAAVVSDAATWGYGPDNGPELWEGVCNNGRSQSPIDIHAADADYAMLHRLHFVHYDHRNLITLSNNGHSVSGSGFNTWLSKQPYISSGGLKHKYKLQQFHLHWSEHDHKGSEHLIGGLSYPAELHLVHHREDLSFQEAVKVRGGLAVVGVFLMIAKDDKPLDALSGLFEEVLMPGNLTDVHGFHPRVLLPAQHDAFYRYEGSLTTPGCFESVIWTVLPEPISVTRKQLAQLRKIHSSEGKPHTHNYRPVQPLNGRKLLYRPAHFDKSTLCGQSASAPMIFAVFSYVFAFHF